MNTETSTPRKHKRYDENFKRSAVELLLQGGKSVRQVADELGISDQSLKQWKKKLAALPAMALTQRQPPVGLVHHSDRGVQYASAAYRQRLAPAGVVPSMSRRGNCYDNAMMESFWNTLKRGLIHPLRLRHARRRARRHLRMDRSLLQPHAVPQRARLPIPCEL